jgi:NAD kinase
LSLHVVESAIVVPTIRDRSALMTEKEDVALTLDGQVGFPIQARDRVIIRKSNTTFNLVQPKNRKLF